MDKFDFTNCDHILDLSDGATLCIIASDRKANGVRKDFFVVSTGYIHGVSTTPGGTSAKLDDVLNQALIALPSSFQARLKYFDVSCVVKLALVNGSSDIMAVTQCEGFAGVWRLVLNDAKTAFASISLVLIHPIGTSMFDASLSSSGLTAVYVDMPAVESSAGTLEPSPEQKYSLMSLNRLLGWQKNEITSAPAGTVPTGIWLAGSTVLVSLRMPSSRRCTIYRVGHGKVWKGNWLEERTVSVSSDGKWVSWLGLSSAKNRILSSHDSVFVLNVASDHVEQVSRSGDSILASGFLDASTLFFTTQNGLSVGSTTVRDLKSGKSTDWPNCPITRNKATRGVYVNESLSTYPCLIVNCKCKIDLPVTSGCDLIQVETWQLETNSMVQGLIYSCSQVTLKTKPYILLLHGGPGVTISPFRSAVAASSDWILKMVLEGYKVLTISYRGTFGFGDDWAQASIGSQGKSDLKDVLDVVDVFNGQLSAIVGSSYGGFLCLHAFCSEDAAVKTVPKFVALYPYISSRGCAAETGDFQWEGEYCGLAQWTMPQYPVPDACLAPDVVPKLYSAAIDRPLLLFHGDSDRVCPISQSRQTLNILRQRGASNVSLVTYKGEDHGFVKKETRDDCIKRVLDFIK